MTAALALAPEVDAVDPVADWLDRLLAGLADLVADADQATDAERIEQSLRDEEPWRARALAFV